MKNSKQKFLPWLVMALLGIFLIVGRGLVQDIIGKVFAIGLILTAGSGFIAWWKNKGKKADDVARMIGYVLLFLLGIWILFNTARFISLINVIIGLIVIIMSLLNLFHGWKSGKDVFTMVVSCIGIILGIVIVTTNAATAWLPVAEGIGLIYTAITGFISERKS